MADYLGNHLLEFYSFVERCLKLKPKFEAVMAPYKEVYKNFQKKEKQLKITCFFTKAFISPYAMHCIFFNHPDTFKPAKLI
jgi:hypothetical protein